MPLKLNVPYTEKENAKALGAWWDSNNKTWVAPNYRKYPDFYRWIPYLGRIS